VVKHQEKSGVWHAKKPVRTGKKANKANKCGTIMAGLPEHVVTEENIRAVKRMASLGTGQEYIARFLGISVDTLTRRYRDYLDDGVEEINSKIAGVLADKALSGNVESMMFWLKTRARWRTADSVAYQKQQDAEAKERLDAASAMNMIAGYLSKDKELQRIYKDTEEKKDGE
jgi:hypothetical protein